ncbi:disease resistance protein RGA2-like [Nymphaea colorata]|nr:disease resistance protein RGA2-like [Nymphaea colorata]
MAIVIDAFAEAAISNMFWSVTSLLKDKVDLIRNAKVEKLQKKLEGLQKTIKVVSLCFREAKSYGFAAKNTKGSWWMGEVADTLMGGAKESKILITSRKVEDSQGIGDKMYKLTEMSLDESWSLFLRVAKIQEHELESHNLKGIGEKIVAKCGGLPLVVQTEYSHASATEHTSHLSLLGIDDAEHKYNASGAANKVRTLLCDPDSDSKSDLRSVYIAHLTNFKWLRVLSLRGYRMYELPKSIEDLSLLKYLDLSYSNVKRLPSSIGRLCNLQILDLSVSKIEELPKEIGELSTLRYLGLKDIEELKFITEGLGMLTNLRILYRLILKEKHELIGVKFYFEEQDDDRVDNASKERSLLEALEPPYGIERLGIYSYKGYRDVIGIKSLEELKVQNCPTLCELPSMLSLKSLEIWLCDGLNKVGDLPALESLTLSRCERLKTLANMPALESLHVYRCERLQQVSDDHMPDLKRLKLSYLKILKQLPTHLPSLEELDVKHLPNWEITLTFMPCLRKASFETCPKVQTEGLIYALLELAGHGGQVTQLRTLSLKNCRSERLGWKLLEQMPNLICLKLDSKSAVLLPSSLPSEVPTFLPSFKALELRDITNVDEELGRPLAMPPETEISVASRLPQSEVSGGCE